MKKNILILSIFMLFIIGCGDNDLKNYTKNYDTIEPIKKMYLDGELEKMKNTLKYFQENNKSTLEVSKMQLKDMVLYSYDNHTGYMPINNALDFKKFIETFDGDIDILKRMVNTGYFPLFLKYLYIDSKNVDYKYKTQIKDNLLSLAKINPDFLYSFERNTNLKLFDLCSEEEVFKLVKPSAAFNIQFTQKFYDKHLKEFTLLALQLSYREVEIFFNTEVAKKSDLRNKIIKYIKTTNDKEVIDRSIYNVYIADKLKSFNVEN